MISLDDALARLCALAPPIAAETVPLAQAAGRWLAEPIAAKRTQPMRDLSAMDGYALRFADLPGPIAVIGESAAGRGFAGDIAHGQAVRIFTGAPLPAGADTILVQEEASRDGDVLTLAGEGPGSVGRHIRRAGLDFSTGEALLAAGDRLTPPALALAAVAGHAALPVRRPIRVAIAATGDELVPPGQPVPADSLPESNSILVAAMLAGLPVTIEQLGILPDDRDAIEATFAAVDADLLITTGGASVGDHDLVRPALQAAGGEIDFWRIAMRPGKPMLAGRLRDTLVIGLPGNPVAAFVTTLRFVKPLVVAMSGGSLPLATRLLPLAGPLPANDHRADHLRATIQGGMVHSAGRQDSSMLRTLAHSDCMILRSPHAPAAQPGDSVEVLMIG